LYDQYGEKGLEAGGGGGGGGGDMFSQMFGGGGGGPRGPQRGKDVQFKLKVQLQDLYNGVESLLHCVSFFYTGAALSLHQGTWLCAI
jgi:DnaJ-class molecular chaperone